MLRKVAMFFGLTLLSLPVCASIQDVIVQIIIDLPFMQLNGLSSWMLLLLLSCVVAIEAYLIHRLLLVPYVKTVRRIAIINLVLLITNILMEIVWIRFNPDTGNATTPLWHLLLFNIILRLVVFVVQVIVACKIFSWFDPSIQKARLCRVMIYANLLSTVFLLGCHVIIKRESYARLLKFDRQLFEQKLKDAGVNLENQFQLRFPQ